MAIASENVYIGTNMDEIKEAKSECKQASG